MCISISDDTYLTLINFYFCSVGFHRTLLMSPNHLKEIIGMSWATRYTSKHSKLGIKEIKESYNKSTIIKKEKVLLYSKLGNGSMVECSFQHAIWGNQNGMAKCLYLSLFSIFSKTKNMTNKVTIVILVTNDVCYQTILRYKYILARYVLESFCCTFFPSRLRLY